MRVSRERSTDREQVEIQIWSRSEEQRAETEAEDANRDVCLQSPR